MAASRSVPDLIHDSDPKLIKLNRENEASGALVPQGGGKLTDLSAGGIHSSLDVVFSILHGPYNEDGTVQGLLKIACVPFVGAGILVSRSAWTRTS